MKQINCILIRSFAMYDFVVNDACIKAEETEISILYTQNERNPSTKNNKEKTTLKSTLNNEMIYNIPANVD